MFIIKYHAKGKKTKYFGADGNLVSNKKSSVAFGENLRNKFKKLENEHCSLVTISVSEVAEMMYFNNHVKVREIKW